MTVENTTTIDGLDPTLPLELDRLNECDNHLRQLKIVKKNIFRGINGIGFSKPIEATESELNYLQGLIDNIEAQLQELKRGEVPIGGIQFFTGVIASIPARFFLCDGNNGTPDMTNLFVYGTAGTQGINGGSASDTVINHTHTQSHGHNGTAENNSNHRHTIGYFVGGGAFSNGNPAPFSSGNTIPTEIDGDHGHSDVMPVETISTQSSGVDPSSTNIPPFYKAAYVMRVS